MQRGVKHVITEGVELAKRIDKGNTIENSRSLFYRTQATFKH